MKEGKSLSGLFPFFNCARGRGLSYEGEWLVWHRVCIGQGMKKLQCPYCHSRKFYKCGRSGPIAAIKFRCRQRYRCRECRRRFSQNSNLLGYRQKKADGALNAKILQLFVLGTSNRQIARVYGVSEECVRRRLDRMAKRALIFHDEMLRTRIGKIKEPVAYDGVENFAGSQYDPNNIQQAIGVESLFVYDFNFAPLNRKGRMSPWQKRRLAEIEEDLGRYNPRAIRTQSEQIFKRLCARAGAGEVLELWSDEHFQYRRAIVRDLRMLKIRHKTVSSKACRNFQNILFSVNHMDLLLRQRVAAFTRETISFAKTAGRMMQKYILFAVYKNYMCAQFTKKHVRRPKAHEQSPAQALGVCDKLLGFKDIFARYPNSAETESFAEEWQDYFNARVPLGCHRSRRFRRKQAA